MHGGVYCDDHPDAGGESVGHVVSKSLSSAFYMTTSLYIVIRRR